MPATLNNVTLRVMLGLGSTPLEEFPSWEDITTACTAFDVGRGRSSVLDRFDAGFGAIQVNNHDGAFDPANTSSGYYPDLVLGTPVTIEVDYDGDTYTLFRGMLEEIPLDYPAAGNQSIGALVVSDLTPMLAGFSLTGFSYPAQFTGERIQSILDDVGWPATLRDVDVGGGYLPEATIDGLSALDHIYEVVDVEAGVFFISADGYATFRSRAGSTGLSSSYTFGEGAGDVRYEALERAYNKDQLFNKIIASRPDGEPQTSSDLTSIDKYGELARSIDAPFVDDSAALNVAEWQVSRTAETVNRVNSLRINPDFDAANMWPAAAGLELRDGVTVELQPPGGGTAMSQLSSVEGVSHSFSASAGTCLTTFNVWPLPTVETESYWILGTSALDTDTVLA